MIIIGTSELTPGDWITAIGALLTITATTGAVLYTGSAARRQLEDDRRRRAKVAAVLIGDRLTAIADEAKKKASWIRKDGIPNVLGEPGKEADYAQAADRLRLKCADSVTDQMREMLLLLDNLEGVLAATSFHLVLEYNRRITAELDAYDPARGIPAFFRQNLDALLRRDLDTIYLNATGNAKKLEDVRWHVPRSERPLRSWLKRKLWKLRKRLARGKH